MRLVQIAHLITGRRYNNLHEGTISIYTDAVSGAIILAGLDTIYLLIPRNGLVPEPYLPLVVPLTDPKTPRELREALEPDAPFFPPNQAIWLRVWLTGLHQARNCVSEAYGTICNGGTGFIEVDDAAQWLDATIDAVNALLPPSPAKSLPSGEEPPCQAPPTKP